MKKPTDTDLVSRVRAVLEDSATERKTVTFGEIERRVGEKIAAWNKVLDPIYDDCMAQGHPDLTAIVIYKETGYPPFFSDGGETRSKRFNPNNLRQVEQKEVSRVFEWFSHSFLPLSPKISGMRDAGIPSERHHSTLNGRGIWLSRPR